MEKQKESIAFEAAPLFSTGTLVLVGSAIGQISPEDIESALERHKRGDWGLVDKEEWKENEGALEIEDFLVSLYRSSTGARFFVVTEPDRISTAVLMPDDYYKLYDD